MLKKPNTIYLSNALQKQLQGICEYPLTSVVAPMAYGKTTAISWFLDKCAKIPGTKVLRINVYSDAPPLFWQSIQRAFAHAGLDVLNEYACPEDTAEAALILDDVCRELAGPDECYIFVDDFHLLHSRPAAELLCSTAMHLPGNVHLIVASRDRIFTEEERIRLGHRLYQFTPQQLRLDKPNLAVYVRRCGANLSEQQLRDLLYNTEGWISAVYLSLQSLTERGTLPGKNSDISALFTTAMIDPLPPVQQEFLTVLRMTDEFTVEMAEAITGRSDAAALLAELTSRNAFVKRLPDSDRYRCHHMLKDCAALAFQKLPEETRTLYYNRYGQWFETHGMLLHALYAYRNGKNYDALLRVTQKDAGILLCSLPPDSVLSTLAECPEKTLRAHPAALLVLMRCMFNWNRVPEMQKLKQQLLAAVDEHPEWGTEERGNLLAECDLLQSFLYYNDIDAMSRMYLSASARLTRPATNICPADGWTFGSPSVLMMFHRTPGKMDEAVAAMRRYVPYYAETTNGHGRCTDCIMAGEAALLRGNFADAEIELERAYAQCEDGGRIHLILCCDFLALRLYLCGYGTLRYSPEERHEHLHQLHNLSWMKLWAGCFSYYYALLGNEARISAPFREHHLSELNLLAPSKPMMDMIENQVLLLQGAWSKVVARSTGQLQACEGFHYALVALYVRIQTAAAYAMLKKQDEAEALLTRALQDAALDGLALPFAENYRRLAPLLQRRPQDAFLNQIALLGGQLAQSIARLQRKGACPAALNGLTDRERDICLLIAQRLRNREIAEKLFLTEGSVKQYLNQIYSKLHFAGDARTKREQLIALVNAPNP